MSIRVHASAAERPAWVDDELFPFESRFIEIGGHQLHYVDEGSGPTLLFLHGNPTWSFDYADVITSLKSDFRCIAVDYPGFGLSVAAPGYQYLPAHHVDVIGEFIGALELSGVTLISHDGGGRSAWRHSSATSPPSTDSCSPTHGHGRSTLRSSESCLTPWAAPSDA